LARALRAGGLVLGALQDLALAYLRRDGDAIPFWRMAVAPVDGLQRRAEAIAADVATASVVACASLPGGGSAPGVEIASVGLALAGDHTARLRAANPPVIGRVVDDTTVLDLRTVDPVDDGALSKALLALDQ
jgi:L-seryl-tRNA(Ser) seleniumtransferase